jgi:hypothetical protein
MVQVARSVRDLLLDLIVEPVLDGLIRSIDTLRSWLAGHRLRASLLYATVVAALSAANIVRSSSSTSPFWDRAWVVGLIAGANVFVAVVAVALVRDYRRIVRSRQVDEGALEEACREIATRVVRLLRIPRERVGVHLWSRGGVLGFRHLERVASDKSGIRMHVIWRKRKGAIGRAWKLRRDIVCFLGTANAVASRAQFNRLPVDRRGYVRWPDFVRMKGSFSAVAAIPLELSIDGSKSVRGCISINILGEDTLPEERFAEFEAAVRSDAKMGQLFAAAQAALEKREEQLRAAS